MMMRCKATRARNGFSLIEMLFVVTVLMILATIVPLLVMNTVSALKLRYAAVDLSSLIQKTRMEAVRKNTFYSIEQTSMGSGDTAYFIDLNKDNTYSSSVDSVVMMGRAVNVHFGTGSGAPAEATLTGSLNFALDATGVLPKFNARGLPCVLVGATCPQTPGQGFIYFLSRNGGAGTSWQSIVVTPSGRVQVFAYDGTNWTKQW